MFITPMGEKSSTHTVRFVRFAFYSSVGVVSSIYVKLISVVILYAAPSLTLKFNLGIFVIVSVRSW